jgi:RHS repeat-associated protein
MGGLMDYKARFYSPYINRFLQPDTVVPSPVIPQSWNKYSYAENNPIKYRDPSGHWVETAFDIISLGMTINDIRNEGFTLMNTISLVTDVASVVLPIVPAGVSHALRAAKYANKAINAVDTAADTIKAVDNIGDAANAIDNTADALKQLDNLPDDELLYQFSRRPNPKTGKYDGFPNTLRTKQGETGMSCQIASLCGYDPAQGFRQQMKGQNPGPGDWVRETTVGDVKKWGGQVDPDYLRNPKLGRGHASIYSTGGKWGNQFDKIWRNKRSIIK